MSPTVYWPGCMTPNTNQIPYCLTLVFVLEDGVPCMNQENVHRLAQSQDGL